MIGIINKPLSLHLVGCLYYLYQWCAVMQISDNEIYLLIKYIKSVLWRVAKRLSYIQDPPCLKVKGHNIFASLSLCVFLVWNQPTHPQSLRHFILGGIYQLTHLLRYFSFPKRCCWTMNFLGDVNKSCFCLFIITQGMKKVKVIRALLGWYSVFTGK